MKFLRTALNVNIRYTVETHFLISLSSIYNPAVDSLLYNNRFLHSIPKLSFQSKNLDPSTKSTNFKASIHSIFANYQIGLHRKFNLASPHHSFRYQSNWTEILFDYQGLLQTVQMSDDNEEPKSGDNSEKKEEDEEEKQEEQEEQEEQPPMLPFFIDYDRRGKAKCKVCKVAFDKGDFRTGKNSYNPFGTGPMKNYHHLDCLFETFKKARATTKKIDDFEEDVEGWGDIEEEDKQKMVDALNEYREWCRKKGVPVTTAPKKDTPAKKTPKAEAGGTAKTPSDKKIANPSPPPPPPSKFTIKDNSFREYRRLCTNIAETSSYLAKTKLVHAFLSKGTGGDVFRGDVELWVRLLLPGVIKRVYNLQSKQLVKLFSQLFDVSHEEMLADLEAGDVAETVRVFFEQSKSGLQPAAKSVASLHDVDRWLTKLEGLTKDQDQMAHLKHVAARCTSNDIKMIVRLIKADLRINAGAKHILDGVHPDAYESFQTTRDLKEVLRAINEGKGGKDSSGGGSGGQNNNKLKIKAKVLTPVLPMLASPCRSVEAAFKKCPRGMYAEIKYDGERVQLHKTGNTFKYFSRSLKPVTDHKVCHFSSYIPTAFPHAGDLILDAEVLLVDTTTGDPLPFGSLGKHKKEEFKDAQVCLFVFDCLHYNGENLMNKPLEERRAVLARNIQEVRHRVQLSELEHLRKPRELAVMIARVLEQGLEGLVLKDTQGVYEPGKRHWLKVKKDYLGDGALADSVDLVVLGAWYGTGKKGGMMSVFLMGCYDPHTSSWCTVTKVHTGHDDAALARLQEELQMHKISGDHNSVPAWLSVAKQLTPDFVAKDPKNSPVWEVTGAELTQNNVHTAEGISVRFPRVTRERSDKTWREATDLPQLKELFKASKERSDYADFLGVPSNAAASNVKAEKEDKEYKVMEENESRVKEDKDEKPTQGSTGGSKDRKKNNASEEKYQHSAKKRKKEDEYEQTRSKHSKKRVDSEEELEEKPRKRDKAEDNDSKRKKQQSTDNDYEEYRRKKQKRKRSDSDEEDYSKSSKKKVSHRSDSD